MPASVRCAMVIDRFGAVARLPPFATWSAAIYVTLESTAALSNVVDSRKVDATMSLFMPHPLEVEATNVTPGDQRLSTAGAKKTQRSPLRLALAFPAASGCRKSTRDGSLLTAPELAIATELTVPLLRYVTS